MGSRTHPLARVASRPPPLRGSGENITGRGTDSPPQMTILDRIKTALFLDRPACRSSVGTCRHSSGTTTLNWHARLVIFAAKLSVEAAIYRWTVY
jgi:hypothetical protein